VLKTALGAQIRVHHHSHVFHWWFWLLLLLYFLWITCFQGCHNLIATDFLCMHFHCSFIHRFYALHLTLCDILCLSLQCRWRYHAPECHLHAAWVETRFHLLLSGGRRGRAADGQGPERVDLLMLGGQGKARRLLKVRGWRRIEGSEVRELGRGFFG
jgi:hypothetical protein